MKLSLFWITAGAFCATVVVTLLVLHREGREGTCPIKACATRSAVAPMVVASNAPESATAPIVKGAWVAKPPEAVDAVVSSVEPTNAQPGAVLAGAGGNPDAQNPEDRDENFAVLSTAELVHRLTNSTDTIELRKAAQVLGDRVIAGTLKLSADENAGVLKVAQQYLKAATAEDSRDYMEAKEQLERLWWLAAPAMVEQVANENLQIADMAYQGLNLMRNEAIVQALVNKTKAATGAKAKTMYLCALGGMTEQYGTYIPRRKCMEAKESEALADKLIRPFLTELEKTETDPEVRQSIASAFDDLKKAVDHRPRDIPLDKVDEKILRMFLTDMEEKGYNPEIQELYRKELERRQREKELQRASP